MTQAAVDNPFSLLSARRSTPFRLLGEPGPSAAQLAALLREAVRVPDHGRLTPWRFIAIQDAARQRFAERLVARLQQREPEAGEAAIAKERDRMAHAPLILVVVGRIDPAHRIPAQEQLLSGGCVCFSLLLAAQAQGFGAQWLTGWAAYDRGVADDLGLSADERVLGFIHVGSAAEAMPERARPDAAALLSHWPVD
ncbi:MAG: nitroreductase [Lysobacteraceae bacterium]